MTMENSILHIDSNYVDHNGYQIRFGIPEHFSRYEIKAFPEKKLQYNHTHISLDALCELSDLESRQLKSYAFILAFYRRITFSLEELIPTAISFRHYDLDEFENFTIFNDIFEKNYPKFEKLNSDNTNMKQDFKDKVTQVLLKLWMCGYGILPGLNDKAIDNEVIEIIRAKMTDKVKIARFLNFALSEEPNSPVTNTFRVKTITSLLDRELGKWKLLKDMFDNEITQSLYDFTFIFQRARINNNHFYEYKDSEGQLVRESLVKITDGTWVQYSLAALELCRELNEYGYTTIDDCINDGLITVLTEVVSTFEKTKKSTIRIVAKLWISYYCKTHRITANINRIVPPSVSNNIQIFGKLFNFGAAITLIETLLDDSSTYFEENTLSDYRARRACLIQLASGQRATSICYLLKDCIKTDIQGTPWLIMHKTKFDSANKVVATPDILKWVKELQAVAPRDKILISPEEYLYGDGLCEYRLLGNQFDDGPLTYDSLNKFLFRIQFKLWGNKNPNGRLFTTHDFRRMHAVYMKMKNRDSVEIQEQLGQEDILSQLPYIITKPIEYQEHFKRIQEKGVYNNIRCNDDEHTDIAIDTIIDTVNNLNNNNYDATALTKVLLDASNSVADFKPPEPQERPLPSGFPMRINSCNATMITNCGHTELHCFKCKHYKPDADTLEDHKIEVFRYMVLKLYQDKESKKTKDMLQQEVIKFRSSEINKLIKDCFDNLFGKFNLTSKEISNIKSTLSEASEKYIKKYYKKNPQPSFIEAKNYLMKGDING